MNDDGRITINMLEPSQVHFAVGKKDTRWHRIKQLVRWIWTGEADFKW